VFPVAKLLVHARPVVLVALALLAVVNAHCGNPTLGMWDGPL
jgi:hypothetical protein